MLFCSALAPLQFGWLIRNLATLVSTAIGSNGCGTSQRKILITCEASGKYAFVQNAMRNALTIATAANNALQQTPRSTAVQSSLDLLFNNGDQTLVNTYGPRKLILGGISSGLTCHKRQR